jgi:hypothetical protein
MNSLNEHPLIHSTHHQSHVFYNALKHESLKYIEEFYYIVMCIVRQRTDKHLATEYTHATIELRMLLLVVRQ